MARRKGSGQVSEQEMRQPSEFGGSGAWDAGLGSGESALRRMYAEDPNEGVEAPVRGWLGGEPEAQ